jgi:hypothetical protein
MPALSLFSKHMEPSAKWHSFEAETEEVVK